MRDEKVLWFDIELYVNVNSRQCVSGTKRLFLIGNYVQASRVFRLSIFQYRQKLLKILFKQQRR